MNKYKRRRAYHASNSYPAVVRLVCLILSVLLLTYAIMSIYRDDFPFPIMRRYQKIRIAHLHGYAAWALFLACLAVASNLLSYIVDHYDKRNNERSYRQYAKVSARIGLFLFFCAMMLQTFLSFASFHR